MKNDQLQSVLEDLGLTESEASVYLASLSLGPSTVLNIAKASQIRRTTVYSVIEALKNKGLMHVEPAGLKQLYAAEHPDKLETMLENKKHMLEKLSPQFLALYNLKGKESTIRYYEGLESIKTIYDTILEPMKPGDDYLVISDLENFFENLDKEYFEKFLQKRIKSRVKARLIVTGSKRSEYMQEYGKQMNHEIRILPNDTRLSVDVIITPQKVTILNLEHPISAISIENSAIIQMHRELFEIIWKSLLDKAPAE